MRNVRVHILYCGFGYKTINYVPTMREKSAKLILKDKTIFEGVLFGSQKATSGEVVFATGMVGYPEALTDPSFAGQIVVFTYPLIGNYGIPKERRGNLASFFERAERERASSVGSRKILGEAQKKNFDHAAHRLNFSLKTQPKFAIGSRNDVLGWPFESKKIWAAGVVVQNYYDDTDHATAVTSFSDWLVEHDIPALAGVDTRALTKKLRERGTILGQISLKTPSSKWEDPNAYNIVENVSCKKPWSYGNGSKKVVLIDCGAKYNIIRELARRDCTVEVVPWDTKILKYEYDGVFISNGPGDPMKCRKTINTIRRVLKQEKPVFGICLGNQLLALAAGAKTQKLPFGHRSQNQPCTDLTTGRCYITTQNHGFNVVGKSLPRGWKEWFVNANDGTNEGIYHQSKPFRSVQFHPEAHPGPEDTEWLFDNFVKSL